MIRETIPALLGLLGLDDAAEQDISAYSKGMRQKVLLIAALLHDPDVLILDEPESGLDVTTAPVLRRLVTTLAARGKGVLYTHVLDNVERICARVIVLHHGTCVAGGTPDELRAVMSRTSLEDVFAQLVVRVDPALVARDIADVVMGHHGERWTRLRQGYGGQARRPRLWRQAPWTVDRGP